MSHPDETAPAPRPARSLSELRSIIDRAIVSARIAADDARRLALDADAFLAATADESLIPQGDRQHAAKWRLLCAEIGVDAKVSHRVALEQARDPQP